MGADAVDAVIKSRLVELRWTRAVSDDGFSSEMVGGEGGSGGKMDGEGLRFERPRIVAMTPVLRKAMEVVIMEDDGTTEEDVVG
jgi:hypothetical protein